jgi:hypothetical protein
MLPPKKTSDGGEGSIPVPKRRVVCWEENLLRKDHIYAIKLNT